MSSNALEKLDKALAERLAKLNAAADQRPSGSISIPVYELDKKGRLANQADKEGDVHDKMLVIPLLLRETRSYWARKGTGDVPDCRSIDGVRPVPGDGAQAELCASCPWDKFGTAEGEAPGSKGAGKKCKTKGNLFALVLGSDGQIVSPAVIRLSLGNKPTGEAIAAADREAAKDGVPRIASIWELAGTEGKGKTQDFLYVKVRYIGPAPAEHIERVVEQAEGLQSGGADRFLGGATAVGE